MNGILSRYPDYFPAFHVAVITLAIQNSSRRGGLVRSALESLHFVEELVKQQGIVGVSFEYQEVSAWGWDEVVELNVNRLVTEKSVVRSVRFLVSDLLQEVEVIASHVDIFRIVAHIDSIQL